MSKIVFAPNQILTTPTKTVGKIDKKIKQIIADMKNTLDSTDEPKGVGLAATQIGVSLRIFLMRPEDNDPIQVMINPEIVSKSEKLVTGIPKEEHHIEGCLSIPQVWGEVKRHESVKLRFVDETGQQHEQDFFGFPAIIVQHEVDHLDGILFTRRVLEQKGQLYKPGLDKNGKEVLEPIEL